MRSSKAAATEDQKPEENKEQKPEGEEQPKPQEHASGAGEQPQEEKKE